MKRLISLFLIFILCALLTSCSPDREKVTLYYDYDMNDFISVGDYSVEVKRDSDEYIKAYIDFYDDTFEEDLSETLTEGVVKIGDEANIHIYGTYKGKDFDGGTSLDYNLRVGKGLFTVEGFERGLVGAKIGSEITLNLTLPENYHNLELAGKDVTYLVRINYVKRFNEPTNSQSRKYGFDSYDDYKKQTDDFCIGVCIFNSAYDAMKINSYPKSELEEMVSNLYDTYKRRCSEKGMTVENYVASLDWTMEEFMDTLYESVQYDSTKMPRYMLSYYILEETDNKLTQQEIENYKAKLINENGEDLEASRIYNITISSFAAYEKALSVCRGMAVVK